MNPKNLSRRQFLNSAASSLGVLGVGTSAFNTMVESLLLKSANLAQANNDPFAREWNYIHFSFPGGPPRWYFDLPLTPAGSGSSFLAGGFGNWLRLQGGKLQSYHTSVKYNNGRQDYYIPPIWAHGSGGFDFRKTLLPHMLMIRGVDMEINSHAISNSRQVAPIVNGLSVSGILADTSRKPMSGVTSGSTAGAAFRSRKGLVAVPMPGGSNPMTTLLRPFAPFPGAAHMHAGDWSRAVDQAMEQFDVYANSNQLPRTSQKEAFDNAISMINSNVMDLSTKTAEAIVKYRNLILGATKIDDVKKIFNFVMKTEDTKHYRYTQSDQRVVAADLRDAFVNNPTVSLMAEQFAVTEILINNNITPSVTAGFSGITGLRVNGSNLALTHDQHNIGTIVSALFTTIYYRAFMTCLCELTNRLKESGKFNKTLIHMASEFNRTPRKDGSGSDHGVNGSGASFLSGAFTQFDIIGNVKVDPSPTNGTYGGTWGVAADYNLGGMSRPIQVNDVAYTAGLMMGLNPNGLVTNARSLVNLSTMKALKVEAKNV